MNKTKQLALISALILILVFVVSCGKPGVRTKPRKATTLDKGINAWNRQGPDAAIHYWSELKNKQQRQAYLGYIDQYNRATKDLDDLVASPPKKESQYLAAYNRLHKTYASLPPSLEIPKPTAKKMTSLSGFSRARVSASAGLRRAEGNWGSTCSRTAPVTPTALRLPHRLLGTCTSSRGWLNSTRFSLPTYP